MKYEHPDKTNRHPVSIKTPTDNHIEEMEPTAKLIPEWNNIIKFKSEEPENESF